MSNHDYANCQDQACALCNAWGYGYGDGYATSLFECAIAACHMSTTPECGCAPCTALRYQIFAMGEGKPGPRVSPPKLGKCAGCDREGMLIQIGPVKVCRKCWV